MLHSLLLRHAEITLEEFIGDEGGVCLERIDLGDVPLQEDLQVAKVHKRQRVGDDPAQELLILLVSAQLRLAVVRSRDHHVIQPQAVFQHVQVGVQAQLPAGVLHLLRYDHLELQVDPSVAFGHIAEAGRHDGGIQPLRGHHFPRLLIPYRLHQYHLPSLQVRHAQRIPPRRAAGRNGRQLRPVGRKPKGRCHLFALDRAQLALCRTGRRDKQQDAYAQAGCLTMRLHGCQKMNSRAIRASSGRKKALVPSSSLLPQYGHA